MWQSHFLRWIGLVLFSKYKRVSTEKKHSKGKALTILAHKLARAVYYMLKQKTAFAISKFLNGSGRGVGELGASLDNPGMTLTIHALQ